MLAAVEVGKGVCVHIDVVEGRGEGGGHGFMLVVFVVWEMGEGMNPHW